MPFNPHWQHGVARVRLRHAVGGSIQSNLFYLHDRLGGATDAEWQAAFDAVVTWWTGSLYSDYAPSDFCGSNVLPLGAEIVYSLDSLVLSVLHFPSWLMPPSPWSTSSPVPACASKAVTWLTKDGGAHRSGRTFLVGLSSALLAGDSSNRLDDAQVDQIEGAYSALWSYLYWSTSPPDRFRQVVYHGDGWPRPDGTHRWYSEVTQAWVRNDRLNTQRARLPGERRNPH